MSRFPNFWACSPPCSRPSPTPFSTSAPSHFPWAISSDSPPASPAWPWPRADFLFGILVVTALTLALRPLLFQLGGAAPWPDAFITSASLWAQWLLNRKSISTWPWWIAVDIVSIPLYLSRDLPLIAILYGLFLALCVKGWTNWRRDLRI